MISSRLSNGEYLAWQAGREPLRRGGRACAALLIKKSLIHDEIGSKIWPSLREPIRKQLHEECRMRAKETPERLARLASGASTKASGGARFFSKRNSW